MWTNLLKFFRSYLVVTCQYCRIVIDDDNVVAHSTVRNACLPMPQAERTKFRNKLRQIQAEERALDPGWFLRLDVKFQTKGEYLFFNTARRIGSYVQKISKTVHDWMIPPGPDSRAYSRPEPIPSDIFEAQIVPFIKALKKLLTEGPRKKLHGSYFVSGEPEAFCDDNGLFHCQCSLPDECPHGHTINPSDSLVERIMFEMWEFDHIVTQNELARFVFTKATDVHQSNGEIFFNLNYFYKKICTRDNLRLVFGGCHAKERRQGLIVSAHAMVTLS